MSRIGKKPISIPKDVKVELKGRTIKVTGPLGSNQMAYHPRMKVKFDDSGKVISVINKHPENRQDKQLHGTTRALIANIVRGVSEGFQKKMEIYGTGFSVKEQAGKLVLQVGLSHPVERKIPEGMKVAISSGVTRGNDIPAVFTLYSER